MLFSNVLKIINYEEIIRFEYKEETTHQIEQSGSWNLVGTRVFIDNNWSVVKATYDWCNGEGTEIEPYIIENVSIDAQNIGSCINIRNSNDYFIIQNCSLYHSGGTPNDAGIKMVNITNGKIINNSCFNNYNGIYIKNSFNNTVSRNNVSQNFRYGVYLDFCDNNTISGNHIISNYFGIDLNKCNNNTVSGNRVINNILEGLDLVYCDNNKVLGNNVSKNSKGIYLRFGDNNIVSGNSFTENGYGIYIWFGNNNVVLRDYVSNNDFYGIALYGCNDTLIYLNHFIKNGQNALDNGERNSWDNGSIGNYWDDYQGVDANGDGIGDTPYSIPGSSVSQDNFPIWNIQPSIPFGNYYILFMTVAVIIFIIIEQQKKNNHLS